MSVLFLLSSKKSGRGRSRLGRWTKVHRCIGCAYAINTGGICTFYGRMSSEFFGNWNACTFPAVNCWEISAFFIAESKNAFRNVSGRSPRLATCTKMQSVKNDLIRYGKLVKMPKNRNALHNKRPVIHSQLSARHGVFWFRLFFIVSIGFDWWNNGIRTIREMISKIRRKRFPCLWLDACKKLY